MKKYIPPSRHNNGEFIIQGRRDLQNMKKSRHRCGTCQNSSNA